MRTRRSLSILWLGLSCLAFLVSGCGKDPFVPGRRTKALPAVTEADRSKPIFLVFVLPGEPTNDQQVWGLRAQQLANDKRVVFRIMGPGPGMSIETQPEIVRKAVSDGASALIVYPGESAELPKALAEAEAKGVAVILISKTVAAPAGSKPFTTVEPGPFDKSAAEVVAATIEDAKKASRPIDGTVLITVDRTTDDSSTSRVAALRSAAEAAKFRQIVMVSFDGMSEFSARLAVAEAIKANPDVSIVLADDSEGLIGAAIARIEAKGNPIFFVGGYTDFRGSPVLQHPTHESCYVEGRFVELGALSVMTALAKLRGEPIGDLALLTPKFVRTEGLIWVEGQTLAPVAVKKSEVLTGGRLDLPSPPAEKKPQ